MKFSPLKEAVWFLETNMLTLFDLLSIPQNQHYRSQFSEKLLLRVKQLRTDDGDGVLMNNSLFVKLMRENQQDDVDDYWYNENTLRGTWSMIIGLAQGFARWKSWSNLNTLKRRPAAELIKTRSPDLKYIDSPADEIDWHAEWLKAMSRLKGKTSAIYTKDKRMVALIEDPIWRSLSIVSLPFPPFRINDQMRWRRVRKSDWEILKHKKCDFPH